MDTSGHSEQHLHNELTPGGFSALLDAAVDAIIIINTRGAILNFNSAAEKLFGYSIDEVIDRNVSILMPAPYRDEHDSYLQHYLESRNPKVIGIGRRVEALKKNGTIFPAELSVGEYVEGARELYIGIIRDLTEREEFENALRESEESLREREQALDLTIRNAPIGILTASINGNVLSANQSACNLMGYDSTSIAELHCLDLVHDKDRETIRQLHQAVLENRIPAFANNTRMVRKDGEIIHVVIHCASVRNSYGEPERLVAQLVDITDQVKAEDEARHIREKFAHVDRVSTMGEMASGIAHEINQPLAAISTYIQALKLRLEKPNTDSAKIQELLDKVEAQSQRAGSIVKQIRAMIRSHDRQTGRRCLLA